MKKKLVFSFSSKCHEKERKKENEIYLDIIEKNTFYIYTITTRIVYKQPQLSSTKKKKTERFFCLAKHVYIWMYCDWIQEKKWRHSIGWISTNQNTSRTSNERLGIYDLDNQYLRMRRKHLLVNPKRGLSFETKDLEIPFCSNKNCLAMMKTIDLLIFIFSPSHNKHSTRPRETLLELQLFKCILKP